MKATELLKSQHREVDELIAELQDAEGCARGPLVAQLASNLVAYSAVETEILYPVCLEEIGSDEDLLESFEEHGLIETCLHTLLSVSVDDETFDAKLAVLKQLFQHHTAKEEDDLFPEMERSLPPARVRELGREIETRFLECVENGYEERLTEAVAEYVPMLRMLSARIHATRTRAAS